MAAASYLHDSGFKTFKPFNRFAEPAWSKGSIPPPLSSPKEGVGTIGTFGTIGTNKLSLEGIAQLLQDF
jgi:hypothetical protein